MVEKKNMMIVNNRRFFFYYCYKLSIIRISCIILFAFFVSLNLFTAFKLKINEDIILVDYQLIISNNQHNNNNNNNNNIKLKVNSSNTNNVTTTTTTTTTPIMTLFLSSNVSKTTTTTTTTSNRSNGLPMNTYNKTTEINNIDSPPLLTTTITQGEVVIHDDDISNPNETELTKIRPNSHIIPSTFVMSSSSSSSSSSSLTSDRNNNTNHVEVIINNNNNKSSIIEKSQLLNIISTSNPPIPNNNNNISSNNSVGGFNKEKKKLPTPIFLASLPKSATTSVYQYFGCGGYKAADHWIDSNVKIGECYERNVINGRPPLEGCGNYTVWTDTGYVTESEKCYFPSVDGLESFYESYPNATIILMTRSTNSWYKSLVRYRGGQVKLKMILCNATGFPNINGTSIDWKNMYEWHQERVRRFVQSHPSLTYLEFSVEDLQVSQKLERSTGIESSCWKSYNVNNNKNNNKEVLNLKTVADIIHNQKPGQRLKDSYSILKTNFNRKFIQLRNLDQVSDLTTTTNSRMEKKRLTTPIFVAGLPCSTMSRRIHNYFTCGGYKSANFQIETLNSTKPIRIGECYQNNVNNGRPPFKGCGDAEVWTETGYSTIDGKCYHPSIDGLDAFRQAYPNGTILYFKRSPRHWSTLLKANRNLEQTLIKCNTTNFPNDVLGEEEWRKVFNWYEIFVRLYGYQYPSLTYLEFPMNDPEFRNNLEAVTGVNASCWS